MVERHSIFRLSADSDAAAREAGKAFLLHSAALATILPEGAEILHVGATAVPGVLTKGDLDIAIRVPDADFEEADAALAPRYTRDTGSIRTLDFSAFEAPAETPPLGIQLAVIDGPYDEFHSFAGALRANPPLVEAYNELKQLFDGQPMETYRAAKALFIQAVLDGVRRGEISAGG